MSDRPLKLILIDDDPIFRLGLRTVLQQFPNLQVIAEVANPTDAVQNIGNFVNTENAINLVILELYLQQNYLLGLGLCQQIKSLYPNLPILLLSGRASSSYLLAAQNLGINGYCPKGTSINVIVEAINQLASGQSYWVEVNNNSTLPPQIDAIAVNNDSSLINKIKQHFRQSGLQQIDANLSVIEDLLQNNLSELNQLVLAGRRRELIAARWLVNKLLAPHVNIQIKLEDSAQETRPLLPASQGNSPQIDDADSANLSLQTNQAGLNYQLQEVAIFNSISRKLQFSLQNLTRLPLEIDVLSYEKKRELLELTLRKFEKILAELRFSQVQPDQIAQKRSIILLDLWREITIDFFGKYYTLIIDNRQLEVVSVLMRDADIVLPAILKKIPSICELFEHFLFETPLSIDNAIYASGTPEALARAEILLQNLIIQLANSVIQPLLNNFANVEAIQQTFYNQKLITLREIATLRNNLSWKYRLEQYVKEPVDIFESRYTLFVLTEEGIRKTFIYAHRYQELEQLPPIQLAVTLLLETRDAIAPRLRSVITFVGKGAVYILTQVIGRGIGLIVRGILQGIGNAWQDNKYNKNSDRGK